MIRYLKKIFYKKYQKQFLHQARACKQLLNGSGEKKVFALLNELIDRSVDFEYPGAKNIENKVVTQYLVSQLLETVAPIAMLTSVRSRYNCLVCAPKQWRNYFKKHGLLISRWSRLIWWYRIIGQFKSGIHILMRLILGNLRNKFIHTPKDDYTILHYIPNNAIDSDNDKTFVGWYLKYTKDQNIWIKSFSNDTYQLSEKIQVYNNTWPKLGNKKDVFLFSMIGLGITVKSLLGMLFGRWVRAFMLEELIYFNYVKCYDKYTIPKKVVFLNSQFTYRPLWTYLVEENGGSADLFFYSSNLANINCKKIGMIGNYPGYQTMSWTKYYVSSVYQARHLNELGVDSNKIITVGDLIPLADSDSVIPDLSGKCIAVFDIQPFRNAFMSSIGRPTHIYTCEIVERFLVDIISECGKLGIKVILKPKRLIPKFTHKGYFKTLEKISHMEHVKIVDDEIAAYRLFDHVNGVVSIPFTSTATLAKKFNLPSIFYDGFAMFEEDQFAAHGIPIINSTNKLNHWLKENILDDQTSL